jgi:hypothetical protein
LSVELISAIFTGLTGLLAATAAILAGRSRRVAEDGRFYRRLAREAQRKFQAALTHIYRLEEELIHARRPVPPRPEILEADEDDDGPAPTRPAGANAST